VLVDKSALERAEEHELERHGEPCLCAVTRLEVLYSAHGPNDYSELERALDAFRELRMDVETFRVAQSAQRELAAAAHHRLPIPDLLIAACAHQHGAAVLHLDRHFDALAGVLELEAIRLGS
jgi:predicted nucleic acid-binding protein